MMSNVHKYHSPSKKSESIKMTHLPIDARARVVSIEGNRAVWERLNEVGLHIGDSITVIRRAPFDGPLLVQSNGQEIAIGRNISSKILVQVIS
jgi:ferrous iron transport protein A